MQERIPAGLFINSEKAQCSIYESGQMAFQCLVGSGKYSLDYLEISPDQRMIPADYDFYLFNYHPIMTWLDPRSIKKMVPGVKMTIVLEVSPNDPFVHYSPRDFDGFLALDPTLNIPREKVFPFPRPLEKFEVKTPYRAREVPVIGSFGFATEGKGFDILMDGINREFDKALVRINIPFATYADERGERARELALLCKERAKAGIEVVVTHDYLTKAELIEWCGQNTINCFFYDRNMSGLAATTDQAIASGRPLLISKNNTFRHIQRFIKPFPYQTIREAIEKTGENVREIQQAWAPERFRERFEGVLETFDFERAPRRAKHPVQLPLRKKVDLVLNLRAKLRLRGRVKEFGQLMGLSSRQVAHDSGPVSHSQYGEDVVVNELLVGLSIRNMSYLDIGANNPKYISNTYLFYEKGFSGVLIEPNKVLCEKLKAERPRDIVLNVGIGFDDQEKEADFHLFAEHADGLGTFSAEEARLWEEVGMSGTKFEVQQIVKVPLMGINCVISNYFTECPDFISIDVEGWDLQILKTLDFEKYCPAVICVETLAYNKDGSTYRNELIRELLEGKGYTLHRETHANTIFVNKNAYEFSLYQHNAREAERAAECLTA